MARTTRKALKASTAVVAPTDADTTLPLIRSNKPAILDDRIIRQYALQAFAEADESVKLQGSATQRLAAAIIAQVQAWQVNGHPDDGVNFSSIPSLAKCHGSKSSSGELLPLLRARFIDDVPTTLKDDARAAAQMQRNKHVTLLGRAFKVAAILAANMLTNASFSVAKGNFMVPPKLLLPTGAAWIGLMAAGSAPTTVMLDGRTYTAQVLSKTTGKPQDVRVSFSVDGLMRAHAPTPKQRKAAAPGAATDSTVDVSKLQAKDFTADTLIDFLYTLLCKTESDGPDMTGAFTAETWSKLSDIAQWNDNSQFRPGFVKDALDKEQSAKRA